MQRINAKIQRTLAETQRIRVKITRTKAKMHRARAKMQSTMAKIQRAGPRCRAGIFLTSPSNLKHYKIRPQHDSKNWTSFGANSGPKITATIALKFNLLKTTTILGTNFGYHFLRFRSSSNKIVMRSWDFRSSFGRPLDQEKLEQL
jgi:hypothetical protein